MLKKENTFLMLASFMCYSVSPTEMTRIHYPVKRDIYAASHMATAQFNSTNY